MFQFATGRSVAHRLGSELLLDVSSFEHYGLRRYELGDWRIDARVATAAELSRAGVVSGRPTSFRRIGRLLGFGHPAHTFREASFAYDPLILEVTDPVYLDGYFQSERYFADVTQNLRTEFVLRQPADEENVAMQAIIKETGASAVSLHIRRGDYVTNAQTAQYHGVCSLDYYRAAVDDMAERIGGGHYFVFSDDLEWVEDNLKLTQPTTLVDVNGPDKGVWDMTLMMACRHHIIANSSFSWWGAWLNPHPDKIVIAPKRWFSGATHDTGDLLPAAWTRL